jgi:ubiquitin-protein ligase
MQEQERNRLKHEAAETKKCAQLNVTKAEHDTREIILGPRDPAATSGSALYLWRALITGPPDSPFAGARFELKIQVPTACK